MTFQFLMTGVREQKMLSWASVGFLVFLSAFLWAPSRDGLQAVYLLSFFLPIVIILFFRKPDFHKYGGWPTVIAIAYATFSVLSTLWGKSEDFFYFVLQWFVLATWLCGSCLIFSRRDLDIEKYLRWFVVLGIFITVVTIVRYYYFVFGVATSDKRLWGWNTFRNANEIGSMCGVIALLAFTIAVQSRSLARTWLFYLFAFVASIGLLASFSRGALVAFIVMAAVALITVRPQLKVWLPPVLMVVVIFLMLLNTPDVHIYYIRGVSEGFGGRFTIWKNVIELCRENLFTGIGMSKNTSIVIPGFEVFNHAHNAWLDTFYRTGVVGLTLVVLHLTAVLKNFSRDPKVLPLYLWLGYGCICGLFDGRCFFWELGAKWFLYWIPIGLITAIITGSYIRKHEYKIIK